MDEFNFPDEEEEEEEIIVEVEKPEKPKFKMTIDKLVDYLESGASELTTKDMRKNKMVEVLDEHGEPMSTAEICDIVKVNQTQGLALLKDLVDEERMGGVKPSGRWIWYLPKWVKGKLSEG